MHSTIIIPGSSGFGFHRKLTRTKTHQGTEKSNEHNGCAVFLRVSTGSGVINYVFYHLSSIFILIHSQFCAQFPFFAFANSTNRVGCPLLTNCAAPNFSILSPFHWARHLPPPATVISRFGSIRWDIIVTTSNFDTPVSIVPAENLI